MNIKLLLQHGTSIYDATPILEGRVEWFASVMGKAGRLKFRVVRDGIVNFVEGDRVSFYVDSVLRFSGFVMTKERTSEQIISVTAYDQMFYLVRNKGTYVFLNKSAKEIIQTIGADYGLEIGYINDGGWRIPQRIEEGETLMDMILSALEICGQATGKEYFLFDRGGQLIVKEKKEMAVEAVLRCDGGISEYTYRTDISKDTYNAVQLYHAGRKEIERKAWKVENAEKVKKWGRLQARTLHDEQRTAEGAGRTYFEGKMQSGEKADGGEHQRGCDAFCREYHLAGDSRTGGNQPAGAGSD